MCSGHLRDFFRRVNRPFYWFNSSQTPFSLTHGAKNEPLAVDYQCRPLCMQRHIGLSDMKPKGRGTHQAGEMSLLLSGFCQKARNILTDPLLMFLFFSFFLNLSFLRICAIMYFNKTMILAILCSVVNDARALYKRSWKRWCCPLLFIGGNWRKTLDLGLWQYGQYIFWKFPQ